MNRNDPNYFSSEYRQRVSSTNPSWMALRWFCFLLTWGRDAVYPLAKARQLDHLHYRSLGREIPLIDVIPLSVGTHRLVTKLRDCGFRKLTNLILHLAGLGWLLADLGIVFGIGLLLTGHGIMVGQAFHGLNGFVGSGMRGASWVLSRL